MAKAKIARGHGLPLDQDVYDAAEWSCIGSLTAASLEHNSMPVAVPDFTRGDWDTVSYTHLDVYKRQPITRSRVLYCSIWVWSIE